MNIIDIKEGIYWVLWKERWGTQDCLGNIKNESLNTDICDIRKKENNNINLYFIGYEIPTTVNCEDIIKIKKIEDNPYENELG